MMKITSEILDCHHGDDVLLHDVLRDDDGHGFDDDYRSDDVHGDEVHLNI